MARKIASAAVFLLSALVLPSDGAAEGVSLEALGGYRWEERLYRVSSSAGGGMSSSLQYATESGYQGILRLGIPVSEQLDLTITGIYDHVTVSVSSRGSNWWFDGRNRLAVGNLSRKSLLGGLRWHPGRNDVVDPYLEIAGGVTAYDLGIRRDVLGYGGDVEYRATASIAAGVRVGLAEHVGIMFEGRGQWLNLDSRMLGDTGGVVEVSALDPLSWSGAAGIFIRF